MSRDATPLDVIEGRAKWCVVCADSRDVLPTLPRVDAVVTDPPYGVNYAGSTTKHGENGFGYSFEDRPELVGAVYAPIIRSAVSISSCCAMTPGRANAFEYDKPAAIGSIFYPSGANNGPWGFVCSQPIFYYGKCPYLSTGKGSRPDSFSTVEATDRTVDHPCPKPVSVMLWMVERASLAGHVVLDPFCGSGTTGVACLRLGRRFIGIEKDAHYAEVARERLEAESRGLTLRDARAGQLSLLGDNP